MTIIRLTKLEDLALASHMVEAFRKKEGIASSPQKREIASRHLLEVSTLGVVNVIGPNEGVSGLCGFNIYFVG